MTCPGSYPVFGGHLTCSKEDDYSSHMSLMHRNEDASREWAISPGDRKRWNVTIVTRGKSKEAPEDVRSGDLPGEGSGDQPGGDTGSLDAPPVGPGGSGQTEAPDPGDAPRGSKAADSMRRRRKQVNPLDKETQ